MPSPPNELLYGLDTDREAQEAQFEVWRRLGPQGRSALAAGTGATLSGSAVSWDTRHT